MRHCDRCGVSEAAAMLGGHQGLLVCSDCDGELECQWVQEDPRERKHSLDTFGPYPND